MYEKEERRVETEERNRAKRQRGDMGGEMRQRGRHRRRDRGKDAERKGAQGTVQRRETVDKRLRRKAESQQET
jgi:hypothetical protein